MAEPRVLHGKLKNVGSGPAQCADCRKFLQNGDLVTHTLDMRRMWHTECFEASLTPFKDWPKSVPGSNKR